MVQTLLIKTTSTFTNYYAVRVDDDISAARVFQEHIQNGSLEWIDSQFVEEVYEERQIAKTDADIVAFIDEAMPYIGKSWSDQKKLDYVVDLTKKEKEG